MTVRGGMSPGKGKQTRALGRLAQPGAVLLPINDGAMFGVFADGDRRRRPGARLSRDSVRQLCSDGAVKADGEGYRITPAGRSRVLRWTDDATPDYAGQHRPVAQCEIPDETSSRDDATRRVTVAECPLLWLSRRGGAKGAAFLAHREFAAGEMLRQAYERSTLTQRVTMNWSMSTPIDGGGWGQGSGLSVNEAQVGATDRVMGALAAVGPGLDGVLRAVCCEARGLEEVERQFGWPQRSGKVVLKIALARLADHFRLG